MPIPICGSRMKDTGIIFYSFRTIDGEDNFFLLEYKILFEILFENLNSFKSIDWYEFLFDLDIS